MAYSLPKGFAASGVHCGIKRFKKDLALIYSKTECIAAAVFTKNEIKAAPLLLSKAILAKSEAVNAMIINSGNANCCTGRYGVKDARRMTECVCKKLRLKINRALVFSTGIIGKRLPIKFIEKAVPRLVKALSKDGVSDAAEAILTTDRKAKIATARTGIGGKVVTVTGIAKGAGMVCPNMATMLSFVFTDANIDRAALKQALKEACDESFNSITVDGDMSPNDTVAILANGLAGNRLIRKNTKEYKIFLTFLKQVMVKLAKNIVEGAEGATKFVTVCVKNAKTKSDAEKVARSIANSCLVKTSIYGENPNWGRVASSAGASGAGWIKQKKMEIYLDRLCTFKGGRFTLASPKKLHRIYKKKKIEILVNLNVGKEKARIWTCDLSKQYVEINSHYMT